MQDFVNLIEGLAFAVLIAYLLKAGPWEKENKK